MSAVSRLMGMAPMRLKNQVTNPLLSNSLL